MIGAPAHTAKTVIEFLTDPFGDRVISKNAAIKWPPKSPDLAPNDYSFWGQAKEFIYHRNCKNFGELKQALDDFIATLSEESVRKMVQSIVRRAKLCLECDGGTFEHLVKKKKVQDSGDDNDNDESEEEESGDDESEDESDDENLEFENGNEEITSSIEMTIENDEEITSSIEIADYDDGERDEKDDEERDEEMGWLKTMDLPAQLTKKPRAFLADYSDSSSSDDEITFKKN